MIVTVLKMMGERERESEEGVGERENNKFSLFICLFICTHPCITHTPTPSQRDLHGPGYTYNSSNISTIVVVVVVVIVVRV